MDELEEQMLRAQQLEDEGDPSGNNDVTNDPDNADADADAEQDGVQDNDANDEAEEEEEEEEELGPAQAALQRHQQRQMELLARRQQQANASASSFLKLHYSSLSLLSAIFLVLYALRTRDQAYLALTYLTSSKLAYIVLGNAVIAVFVTAFRFAVNASLGGLRPAETEHISENMRWNITETCIALTIFRSEVDVNMAGMFLTLVFMKCMHWAAELRGGHLRMTEEVFFFVDPPTSNEARQDDADAGNATQEDDNGGSGGRSLSSSSGKWLGTILLVLTPKPIALSAQTLYYRCPRIPFAQVKFLSLVYTLLLVDCMAMAHCGLTVAAQGPSVHILFGFEAAILTTSALSTLATYGLHVTDGWITVLHHLADPNYHIHGLGLYHDVVPEQMPPVDEDGNAPAAAAAAAAAAPHASAARRIVERISSSWRDCRATLSFTIELAAHALRFLFYLMFFAIVFTYYGMPINIFREVYVSYQQLRQRLTSFANYRRLTANMNERFEAVRSDEELDELGRTCIICWDAMDARGGCKKLPGCGHCFHGHCLREWLVQQQSCPTCRGDIQANEARARTERAAQERDDAAARAADVSEEMDLSEDADPAIHVVKVLKKYTFPCLYRVTAAAPGARVFEESGKTVVRTVPPGKVLLCTGMKLVVRKSQPTASSIQSSAAREAEREHSKSMLNLPDGWVLVDDVERVRSLVPMP